MKNISLGNGFEIAVDGLEFDDGEGGKTFSARRTPGKERCAVYFSRPPRGNVLTLNVFWGDATEARRQFFPEGESGKPIVMEQPKVPFGHPDWSAKAVFGPVGKEEPDTPLTDEGEGIECLLTKGIWEVACDFPDLITITLAKKGEKPMMVAIGIQ